MEQGAGVDALIEPIARIPADRVKRYLELGCGYGFSVDAAQRLFGWQGLGLDPSPLAKSGRDGLAIDIQPIYATTEIDLGGSFDVVYASEVIEHVDDPTPFIEICAAHLSPSGTLVLTTPDAASIRPDVPMAELILALSPGHHLILYTAEGLRHLLRAAGFQHVSVETGGHRLIAYASMQPLDFETNAPLDRTQYRTYLTQVLSREGLPASLERGLRHRLLKELTNAAEYGAAATVLNVLSADIEKTFGFSIWAPIPETVLEKVRGGTISGRFGAPWCLAGILYFAGMIAQNGERNSASAAVLFDQAARVAAAFRRSYAVIGIDDGETSMFERDAPGQALLSLSQVDPSAVANRLAEASASPSSGWIERIVFCLIDLGHLESAKLASAHIPELHSIAEGYIRLHRRGDAVSAMAAFRQVTGTGSRAERARKGLAAASLQAVLVARPDQMDALMEPICEIGDRLSVEELTPIFVNLTDRGLFDAAARLEPRLRDVPSWRVANAVGMSELLHHHRPAEAAEAFSRSWNYILADSTDQRWPEYCRVKHHEVLAYLVGSDGNAAAGAALDLLGAGAPDWVTDAARADLRALLADHPAVRSIMETLPDA